MEPNAFSTSKGIIVDSPKFDAFETRPQALVTSWAVKWILKKPNIDLWGTSDNYGL